MLRKLFVIAECTKARTQKLLVYNCKVSIWSKNIYNNLLLEMVYNVHLSPLITVALSKNSIEKKEYKAMNTIVGKSNQKQVLHLIGQQ